MARDEVWEGPARAVVHGSLLFPGHASLWFRAGTWGGVLTIDAFAPLDASLRLELELRGDRRRPVVVEQIASRPGIQSSVATVLRFRGEGLGPAVRRGGVGGEVFDVLENRA